MPVSSRPTGCRRAAASASVTCRGGRRSRWISCSARRRPEAPGSGGDKAVDLAIAEQPSAVLLHHLVGVSAARPDLRAVGAVLHHGPVRPHPAALAPTGG